jgi:hypothetical protein
MRKQLLTGSVLAALALAPFAAQAQILQDTQNGLQNGAAQGNEAAGPIGGIVGGALGAGVGAATGAVGTATGIATGAVNGATGVVGGIFGAEQPRFNSYAQGQNLPSYAYRHPLRVGAILPRTGPAYYEVPSDYPNAQRYRYARVNDRTVLIDARTRRVVEILD